MRERRGSGHVEDRKDYVRLSGRLAGKGAADLYKIYKRDREHPDMAVRKELKNSQRNYGMYKRKGATLSFKRYLK